MLRPTGSISAFCRQCFSRPSRPGILNQQAPDLSFALAEGCLVQISHEAGGRQKLRLRLRILRPVLAHTLKLLPSCLGADLPNLETHMLEVVFDKMGLYRRDSSSS